MERASPADYLWIWPIFFNAVMPAEAGIQDLHGVARNARKPLYELDSGFRRNDSKESIVEMTTGKEAASLSKNLK